MELLPLLLPLVSDATPVKSKVTLRLTALQGIGMLHTHSKHFHQEGICCCAGYHMCIYYLCVLITTQFPLHMDAKESE